jgi:peptide/nickel transport system ATP-binding protein
VTCLNGQAGRGGDVAERTGEALLAARGLAVELGGREVVRGVDLELRPGEAVGLVGASGSGKSALARALVGLERARGSLRFAGAELVGGPASAWRPLRRRVQLCWQDGALDPELRVAALVDEARRLAGRPRLSEAERARLLARVALDPGLATRRPAALSGGQRQRVAIARALAAEPDLLIADEVTSALDRPVAWALVDLLRGLVADGLGLLLVTHDLSLLPGTVGQVLVLDGGEVVERGAPSALLAAPRHPATAALRAAVPRLPRAGDSTA